MSRSELFSTELEYAEPIKKLTERLELECVELKYYITTELLYTKQKWNVIECCSVADMVD